MAGVHPRAQKVVVAMSGGVDSSVAAAILVQEGYEAIGVTMQIWPTAIGPEEKFSRTCCSLSAAEDARKVAARIGIPHYVLNFKDVFEKTVIDNFIEEYRRGRTPNPCVRCNRFVKFQALLEKAHALGADYVATGHYSRIVYDEASNRWLLRRGIDRSKDQSYALYGMSQYQLAHTLMPLGNMVKDETRRLAADLGLAVSSKPDSQEICFVEDRNYRAFLEAVAPEVAKPGPIFDTAGGVMGEHKGIAFYTVGQRRRLGIAAGEPLYVLRIDPGRNAVVVGREADLYAQGLIAADLSYVSIESLVEPVAVTAKVRYNMKDSQALLSPWAEGQALLTFERPQRAIAPGQAVVFYHGEDVLGGGTIENVIRNT
ncbi:MAG TPA: tRNA 2-thiouridine(34) synthase MnmA [Armatimonadota bacterium]|nr:tRNA 2-thiouridine(34) synthase MnmA [Armatimonadota bacterium]